ncbi:3-oxoacyl-[acyl-carrier-protein] synthase III [Renibacterium salmoninarum ATCC 33209]|uniref:3-oxoacyl-[acyl-carrier-protein] synthase III n=2 Tax=Renibacterium salmoninarum TaxID=1646 RepID=A9WLQ8_RENSM|nr:3-oxoacyl-[acyl-carrier-protein] synthase III [Renibacterium salmoninarum ATCC 33209]
MAARSALEVVQTAGALPEEIDLVIVTTESSVVQSPPLAPLIAQQVGAQNAGAFDLGAACAGFCYGMSVASGLIGGGGAEKILLVAAEQTSIWLHYQDPNTAGIFGDGAGAALISAAANRTIWPAAMYPDGTKHDLIGMSQGNLRHAFDSSPPIWPSSSMKGAGVFRWVIENSSSIIDKALKNAGKEIEVFVPHQANFRITEELVKRLGFSGAILANDVSTMGNTSSASIPLAAAALLASGRAQPGQLALFFGFGAGMTAAAQVVRLPAAYSLLEG